MAEANDAVAVLAASADRSDEALRRLGLALFVRARCLRETAPPARVLEAVQEALEVLVRAGGADGGSRGMAHALRAAVLHELDRRPEARAEAEEALARLEPWLDDPHAGEHYAWAAERLALDASDRGDAVGQLHFWRLALTAWRAVVVWRPTFRLRAGLVAGDVAALLREAGRGAESVEVAEEALRLTDEYVDAHVRARSSLAASLSMVGRHDEAIALAQGAVEARRIAHAGCPDSADEGGALAAALYRAASCLAAVGRGGEARAAIEEALALCGRHRRPHLAQDLERLQGSLGPG